jgi:hypothetical protein
VSAAATALEALVRTIATEAAREVVQNAIASLRPSQAAATEWVSQVDGAAIAGVTAQTIRTWQAEGKLTKGRRGRVQVDELRRFLAAQGGEAAPTVQVESLHSRRAKLAAQELAAKMAARTIP